MARNQNLTDYIDNKIKEAQGTTQNPSKGLRGHLGASIIGRPCYRELWYSFRWATRGQFDGRVLRLFGRGFKEEDSFVELFKIAGATVLPVDPATGKQFGFKGVRGHFAGSMDGIAQHVPYQVEELNVSFDDWILTEFKTHNDASFKKLVAENDLWTAKPEHYTQMNIYIDEKQLAGGIYGAVNKNTDELYFEFVKPDPVLAEKTRQKASVIVHSAQPPNRISNSPSWYVCKYCDHRKTCHFGVPMVKSCRTCVSALPVDDGRWMCQLYGKLIPQDFEAIGCDNYKQITD